MCSHSATFNERSNERTHASTMQRYAYTKQIGQEEPEEAGMGHLEIAKRQQRQARRRRAMFIGGGVFIGILILGIATMGVWIIIKLFTIRETQENTVGESVLRTDRDCYNVHVTTSATTKYWDFCYGDGTISATGQFFGKLCLSDELVEWDFRFIDGVLGNVPTVVWLHQQLNGLGEEDIFQTWWDGCASLFDPTIVFDPVPEYINRVVAIDTTSLGGAISGSITGSIAVDADVGARLRSNPTRIVIAGDDDFPIIADEDIDYWEIGRAHV